MINFVQTRLIFRLVQLFFLFLLIVVQFSCKKYDGCLKQSGESTETHRQLDYFDEILLYDHFDVKLFPDTVDKIVLRGGQYLLPSVETLVTDSTLEIHDNNSCHWVRNYVALVSIDIHFTDIHRVNILGASKLRSADTIKSDPLTIEFSADIADCDITVDCRYVAVNMYETHGSVIVRGRTISARTYLAGAGTLDFGQLHTEHAWVQHHGAGKLFINASKTLYITQSGSGNIYVKQIPDKFRILEKSGTGKIIF